MFFLFNDTAPTEIYTLSLHDALPISVASLACLLAEEFARFAAGRRRIQQCDRRARHRANQKRQKNAARDRKSTRLNSSHTVISYAVFCLKKKIQTKKYHQGNAD